MLDARNTPTIPPNLPVLNDWKTCVKDSASLALAFQEPGGRGKLTCLSFALTTIKKLLGEHPFIFAWFGIRNNRFTVVLVATNANGQPIQSLPPVYAEKSWYVPLAESLETLLKSIPEPMPAEIVIPWLKDWFGAYKATHDMFITYSNKPPHPPLDTPLLGYRFKTSNFQRSYDLHQDNPDAYILGVGLVLHPPVIAEALLLPLQLGLVLSTYEAANGPSVATNATVFEDLSLPSPPH